MYKVILASVSFHTTFTFQTKFLGLGFIHAFALEDEEILGRVDISHDYFDMQTHTPEKTAETILADSPDLVGFGCYVWNWPHILEAVRRIKDRAPHIKIVLGGPQVEFDYMEILEKYASVDFVSVGEGEENFRDLLHDLINGGEVSDIPGIAFRSGDKAIFPGHRVLSKEIDQYPSPYLAGVLDTDPIMGGAFFQTTRGCPYDCAYCTWSRQRPYSEFSLERIEAEFELFKAQKSDTLFCVDSTFNLNNKRAIEILNIAGRIHLEAAFWLEVHPGLLDEAFADALRKVRLSNMGLGIQTTHPETMEIIHRKWDPDKVGALLNRLDFHKNNYYGFEIIMGLPGDDLSTFKQTLTWSYRHNPVSLLAFIFQVLPRSPLHRDQDRYGIQHGGENGLYQIISNDTFPADQVRVGKSMRAWHRVLQQLFYRFSHATGLPAGDLIEQWAWYAYEAGFEDDLDSFNRHAVDSDLFDKLARAFEAFCSTVLAREGLEDISKQMCEVLRYFNARRTVTMGTTTFFDAVDVYGITVDPDHNRIEKKGVFDEKKIPETAFQITFSYNMEKLWPMKELKSMRDLEEEMHTYYFFSDDKGRPVTVEA